MKPGATNFLYEFSGRVFCLAVLVTLLAVINPNSGPGRSEDPNYVQGIKNLQAAGVVVLGYVSTGYGRLSLSKVESQVSSYKNWYSVNGIFFDGMAYVTGSEKYYS